MPSWFAFFFSICGLLQTVLISVRQGLLNEEPTHTSSPDSRFVLYLCYSRTFDEAGMLTKSEAYAGKFSGPSCFYVRRHGITNVCF